GPHRTSTPSPTTPSPAPADLALSRPPPALPTLCPSPTARPRQFAVGSAVRSTDSAANCRVHGRGSDRVVGMVGRWGAGVRVVGAAGGAGRGGGGSAGRGGGGAGLRGFGGPWRACAPMLGSMTSRAAHDAAPSGDEDAQRRPEAP